MRITTMKYGDHFYIVACTQYNTFHKQLHKPFGDHNIEISFNGYKSEIIGCFSLENNLICNILIVGNTSITFYSPSRI